MPGGASSYNRPYNNQNEDIMKSKSEEVRSIAMKLRMDEAEESSKRAHSVHDVQKDIQGEQMLGEEGWEKHKERQRKR